ncbi:hypothetical protein DESC_870003 [Desulfosarcina cetonica]|nr:hypothetical protein DESC_870003 [Desulfosarcina cetonica]
MPIILRDVPPATSGIPHGCRRAALLEEALKDLIKKYENHKIKGGDKCQLKNAPFAGK